jgi:hypothetical protein
LWQHCRLIAASLPTYIAALIVGFLYSGMMPLPHSCGIMLLATKQYETNLSQCGIIANLSMQHSQALVAASPSYLYSGIIATHLRSQGLAAYLSSYDNIAVHLSSQALAAH